MKKIFIDVGGHVGETLDEVLSAAYRFDIVHCLEPQRRCCDIIARKFTGAIDSGRLMLHKYGLADFNGESNLYGGASSNIGASMFADKQDIDGDEVEKCRFIRASDFFAAHISDGDWVVVKLNCEGGELPILRDLIESSAVHLATNIRIDFDIRKIPRLRCEEENILSQLRNCGFADYVLVDEQERVKIWSPLKFRKVLKRITTSHADSMRQWLVFHSSAPAMIKRLSVSERFLLSLSPEWRNFCLYMRRKLTRLFTVYQD